MNWHRSGAAYLSILLVSACSSNTDAPTNSNGPTGQQDISNVIYVGPTDEALVRQLDVAPKADPRQAVIVDSPDLAVPVSKDSPATLQFHLASESAHVKDLRSTPANSRSKWQRGFHEVLQFLSPERVAHAHGVPFNGTAYYLVITDKDSNQILQVFTSQTAFTPEAVDWQHLVDRSE